MDPRQAYYDQTKYRILGRDPFNQNCNRSDREKWSTSKGGPVFSKLFRLDRTDPLSFGPKFSEILVEWIAPLVFFWHQSEARKAATIWNWSGKTLSPGALLAVLYFSSFHIYFSTRLDFPSPPLSAPGSPRMFVTCTSTWQHGN